MTEVQSHQNVSNSNSIEQIYSVQGDTSYLSKKEYLVKRKADKRYRDLLKSARKINLSPEQYTIQHFDCTVDEYCGSEYIQSKVFSGFSPGLNGSQLKTIQTVNNQIKKDLPFFMPFKDFQILLQSILYNSAYSNGDSNHIYYIHTAHQNQDSSALKIQFDNDNPKPKLLIRNKIGTENYINDIYRRIYYPNEATYGRYLYVNIVDYIHIFIKTMNKHINICMQDDSIELVYENHSFKSMTDRLSSGNLNSCLANAFYISKSQNDTYPNTQELHDIVRHETKQYFLSKVASDQSLIYFNSVNY